MGHKRPQVEATRPTQDASHISQQQTESVAQMVAMHSAAATLVDAQADALSAAPSVQMS